MRVANEPKNADDRLCPSCGVDLMPFFDVLKRYRQFLDEMKHDRVTKIGSVALLSPRVPSRKSAQPVQ
jgi:hypothetical protein